MVRLYKIVCLGLCILAAAAVIWCLLAEFGVLHTNPLLIKAF
jgi:hypothetical protein